MSSNYRMLREYIGGGRGIRTPGTVSGPTVFKTAAIDRSAIPPRVAPHSSSRGASEADEPMCTGWRCARSGRSVERRTPRCVVERRQRPRRSMAADTMLGEPPLAHPPELGVTPAAPPASSQHADAHHADRQSHRERPHSAMSPARENDASGAPTSVPLCTRVGSGTRILHRGAAASWSTKARSR